MDIEEAKEKLKYFAKYDALTLNDAIVEVLAELDSKDKVIELMADNINQYNPYYKQFNTSLDFVKQEFEIKAREI